MPDWTGTKLKAHWASRLFALLMSVAILVVLYRSVDVRKVYEVLRHSDPVWATVSVGMIAPITFLRAIRFKMVMPRGVIPDWWDALRLTLVASAFNLFLPAKAGDFVKSAIVSRRGASLGLSAAVVVYERLSDMGGMVLLCIGGYLVVRPAAPLLPTWVWIAVALVGAMSLALVLSERLAVVIKNVIRVPRLARLDTVARVVAVWEELLKQLRGRRVFLAGYSLGLWLIHFIQIWMFTIAVRAEMPFIVCASLSAITLIVSQIPVTIGGLGLRDVTIVLLFTPYMSSEQAAAIGVLALSRSLLPPLAALPMLRSYLSQSHANRRAREFQTAPLATRPVHRDGSKSD